MIQLLRPPKPQKLADNEAELTERFKKITKMLYGIGLILEVHY